GVKLSLLLNGQEVSEKRIGRTINNPKKQITLVEYISLDLVSGAENTLEVVMEDNFGNVRGRQTATVRCPGQPAGLVITTEPENVPADGKSLLTVRVSVRDKAGLPVKTSGAMTVSVSDGDIVEKDVSKGDDGHQVACTDGQAVFTIRAPRTSVEATVTAEFDAIEQKQKVFFPADLSDLMLIGVAEMTIGLGSSNSGFRGLSHSDNDWFEDGAYAGGRTAFFAKGKITDTILLTAAYDTHKPKQDDFFDENLGDVDAEDQYPLYGDESRSGNDAQSRDKLYLRLDRGRSNILYGDYETDFTDTTLARYTRTFTGLKGNYIGERLRVTGFAAHSDQVQVVDTIPARGISGYYYFSRGRVVDGSERVVIETRDRYRPGHIIHSESKARGADYEMEYDTGAILFKAPIPSYDSDFNPVYIVVSYESESAAEENYTYGGRAVYQATDFLDLGVTGIVEENDIDDESLYGADLTLRLPLQTVLKSEIAWSESLFDANGQPDDLRQDSAWLIELESRPIDGLFLRPYYKETGEDFRNDSATNSIGGRREAGVDVQYYLNNTTKLHAQHLDERDTVNDAFYRKTSIGLDKQFGKTSIGLDLAYENSSDGPINTQTSDTFRFIDRSSFDISEETIEDSLSLTLRTETQLWKNLSLVLSHRQELRYEDYNITQAGLRYRLPRNTAIYAKEEWARYTDRTESRLVLGMETDVTKNTTGYSEYRLADGSDGRSVQQGIGLRNTWSLTDTLSGTASAEHLITTSGAERTNQPDAFALAGSAQYLPNDYLKITSRLEYRDATDETSTLAELGMALKLHRDLSMLGRYRLFRDDFKDDGRRVTSRLLTGLAYRPVAHNRFSALAKFEYKQEEDNTTEFATDSDSTIASLEMIYQLTSAVQVAGKYAGKLVKDQDSNYTDL
ncbi:MAG TPA: Ig-like domain-containing protein, partial [Lentisphaeria bacterium]|nr:Ig-like domain-containing protein [Lentisphaeria bacterium]